MAILVSFYFMHQDLINLFLVTFQLLVVMLIHKMGVFTWPVHLCMKSVCTNTSSQDMVRTSTK